MPAGMRRQNHSCDQCRKAKRACDAPSLRDTARRSYVVGPLRGDADKANELEYRACSYCQKTNKQCTLNWARSQLSSAPARTGEQRRLKRTRSKSQASHARPADAPAASTTSNTITMNASTTPGSPTGSSPSAPPTDTPTPNAPGMPVAQAQIQQPLPPQQPPQKPAPQRAFPSPPPSMTPASTMRTGSEMGDLIEMGASAGMPGAPLDLSLRDTFDSHTFGPIPNLDAYNAMSLDGHLGPAHPNQHQPRRQPSFSGGAVLSSLGFHTVSTASGDASSLLGMPQYGALPATTAEVAARPALNGMLPDQQGLLGILLHENEPQNTLDVSGTHGIFSASAVDDEDAGSTSETADDTFALQRSFQAPYASMVSPAPTSTAEHMMAARINSLSISDNLLQIYHDVLEHNLTCWITEETCPYNIWARPAKQKQLRALAPGGTPQPVTEPQPRQLQKSHRIAGGSELAVGGRRSWEPHQSYKQQFGPNWSNRVYRRVTRLDRIAQAAGIMRLSRTQNQASQRALHLVIMAFATQWAQGSQRQREAYTAGFAHTPHASVEEFDRSIQRALWHQARQALQDCADIESYRVVCAELIFGLTQRPWEEYEFAELELSTSLAQIPPAAEADKDDAAPRMRTREAILSKLAEVMDKDGPPIFIERAARKMHALKSTFDNYELGFLGDECAERAAGGGARLTTEDGQTVGLLFWMAAMFDTISASLTERPVVLADDESQHEAAEHDKMFPGAAFHGDDVDDTAGAAAIALSIKKSNRWRIDLFIQDNPERLSHQYHYPCSYDDAAHTITHATPVKVLMYRQVLYLQNMLRKPYLTKGRPTEEIVSETLLIYRYWNIKYGAFFRELIQHYPTVPARIRGWFVCILAHWHLGALMLADVLELVDRTGLGLDANRQMRASARTVATVRHASAAQLADLARVATPLIPNATSDPCMPDFHSAVSEGTILTEPWTILLIRAFSKATTIHLRASDEHQAQARQAQEALEAQQAQEEQQESLRRCEDCIQALWYLGKKSDMARNVAVVLFRAMNAK